MNKETNILQKFYQQLCDLRNKREGVVLALISCIGLILYHKSYNISFICEDYTRIVYNPFIKQLNFDILWQYEPSRFLTNCMFLLNYFIGGLNVFGWHLVNLLLHILVSFLVYCFIRLSFQMPKLRGIYSAQDQFLLALFSSLLFFVHPIQTQAVIYVGQRATLLASLFYLVTIYLYVLARLNNRGNYYFYAIVTSFFGMLTKPSVVTLPIAIFVYEICFFKQDPKIDLKRLGTILVLILPLIIIPFGLLGNEKLIQLAADGYQVATFKEHLLTKLNLLLTDIRLLFLPIDQNFDYDYKISHRLFEYPTFISFLAIIIIIILGMKMIKKWPLMAFGIFWFFITLDLQASIFPSSDFIQEHWLYLPSFGFTLFVCVGAHKIFKTKQLLLCTLLVLIGIFILLTYKRIDIWQNPIVLFEDAVAQSPYKASAHNNLGYMLNLKGSVLEAEEEYKKAIFLNPNYFVAYNNLAFLYYEQERYLEAKTIFERLVKLYPNYSDPYIGLANIYKKLKNNVQALNFFKTADKINPYSFAVHAGLGNIYSEQGNWQDAQEEFEKTISLNPDNASAYYNLGNISFQCQRFEEAMKNYYKATKLKPDFAEAYNNIGNIFFYFHDYKKAKEYYERAVQYDVSLAQGYFNLANSLYALGEVDQSKQVIGNALKFYRNLGRSDIVESIEKKLNASGD